MSVPACTLATMTTDLPSPLTALAKFQRGIATRSQLLEIGLSKGFIAARLSRGSWQRVCPGVYAMFSGELSRQAVLWAAVLYAGPGAALSHQTAAELWRLTDTQSSLIHLTVPGDRRVRTRMGIIIHVSAHASRKSHPAAMPPRTRIEDTVLDLWQAAKTSDEAISWVVHALGRRLTTQDKLRRAAESRNRLRWRSQLAELLSSDMAGLHSILEYRWVRDVERPHRLPTGTRQAHSRRAGKSEYRDVLYEAYATAIELDGQVAHPADAKWHDAHRDNAAAAVGIITLRYGWRDVTKTPCRVAAEVAEVLKHRGYTRARPCSAECSVARHRPRQPRPAKPA